MGMRQDDFWSQTLYEWDARIAGFIKAREGGGGDEPFTSDDYDKLKRQVAESREQSAPPSDKAIV